MKQKYMAWFLIRGDEITIGKERFKVLLAKTEGELTTLSLMQKPDQYVKNLIVPRNKEFKTFNKLEVR